MRKLLLAALLLVSVNAHAFNSTVQHCGALAGFVDGAAKMKAEGKTRARVVRTLYKVVSAGDQKAQEINLDVLPYVLVNIDLLYEHNVEFGAVLPDVVGQECMKTLGKEYQ